MRFRSYFKPEAPQSDLENCVAHNGSIVPVPGRDIMVQGWYQGGISVFDFTDSARPIEIAFFDRGPIDAKELVLAGHWSAYWNNGFIYGSEIGRGVDVLRLTPSEHLSQNEIDAAGLVRTIELNTQQQRRVAWPPNAVVARAYLDQLARGSAVSRERVSAVRAALDRGAADELEALARAGSIETAWWQERRLSLQSSRTRGCRGQTAGSRLPAVRGPLTPLTPDPRGSGVISPPAEAEYSRNLPATAVFQLTRKAHLS
jgi:hypothetical protein